MGITMILSLLSGVALFLFGMSCLLYTSADLGETCGNIIAQSYKLMAEIKPDAVLVLGDTNSCLSVIGAKMCIRDSIYTLIMLLNSIITPSAYSALHSGHVGSYSSSTTFRLNPAYLLLFTMFMVIIISRNVYINNIAYILVAIIVASTVLNEMCIRDRNRDYIYVCKMF